MKDLTKYIIEKFKISKDIKVNDEEYYLTPFADKMDDFPNAQSFNPNPKRYIYFLTYNDILNYYNNILDKTWSNGGNFVCYKLFKDVDIEDIVSDKVDWNSTISYKKYGEYTDFKNVIQKT